MKNSGGPLDNQTWQTDGWPQQKFPKFGFRTHTTALWPMEQSSILSAKFDYPVARQKCSFLGSVQASRSERVNEIDSMHSVPRWLDRPTM